MCRIIEELYTQYVAKAASELTIIIAICLVIASSPGLFPAFQYCTLWEWDGPGDMDKATHVMQCNDWSLVFFSHK